MANALAPTSYGQSVFYSTNEKSSVAIAKPIPRPDRLLSRDRQDAAAVVDERLRVRGIGRLRVIDASIMPTVVSGNTNTAAVMIG